MEQEKTMKVYHVETKEAYDELMIELEEKGYNWLSRHKPTFKNYWFVYKEDTCVKISGKKITFVSIEQQKNKYWDFPIIEYKAKGETWNKKK